MKFGDMIKKNMEERDPRLPLLSDKLYSKLFARCKGLKAASVLMTSPDKYVKKVNNASGRFEVIDKEYYSYGADKGEWWYDEIEPQEYYEEYLERDCEYQFHCWKGKAFWLQLKAPKPHDVERLLTMDLEDIGICVNTKNEYSYDLPIPELFSKLREAAEMLAKGLNYVRVDLYIPNNSVFYDIYFSELTFAPVAGKINPKLNIKIG